MRGKTGAWNRFAGDLIETKDNEFDRAYKKVDMSLKTQSVAYDEVGLKNIAGSLKDIHHVLLKKEESFKNDLVGIRQLLDEIRNLQRENY